MSAIKAGHTVRIREGYEEFIGTRLGGPYGNLDGTEFVVTGVRSVEKSLNATGDTEFVTGDPNYWGIWISYVERVKK